MDRTLSAPMTPVFKFLFPAVWIPGFGYGTYLLWARPEEVVFNGVRGAATRGDQITFLVFFAVGALFTLALARVLKRVVLTERGLRVSNYFTEVLIPMEGVKAVSQSTVILGGMIRIELRRDFGLGKTVRFLPPYRPLMFWREHEIVKELRMRAGLQRQ